MKKEFLILFLFIILFSTISSSCKEGQIDINSASAEELDKLAGIGSVKSQAIIDTRPFNSVDNLIDVVGIGEATLANIKQQGLACVEDEEDSEKDDEEIEEEEEEVVEETKKDEIKTTLKETSKIAEEKVKLITLSSNTQNIKSENSKQLDKSKLPIYGLITFCLLLITLFMLKKSRYKENEFR
jgi:competence ComEA-like helix-hairpin-helix protein